MEDVAQLISSVGFPIVACCFMAWLYVQMNNTLKELTVAITELSTKFTDHVESVTIGGTDA